MVWSNGFFTLTNNPHFADVRVRMLERWATPEFMGRAPKSKTVTPTHFGEDGVAVPVRSYAVLRSWAIWRARQGTFLAGRRSRRELFNRELALLREELRSLGCGGRTGHPGADELIESWTPDVFAPG